MLSPGSSRAGWRYSSTAKAIRASMSSRGAQAIAAPSLVNCNTICSVAVGPVGKARNAQLDRARSSCAWARRCAFAASKSPARPIRPLITMPTHCAIRKNLADSEATR